MLKTISLAAAILLSAEAAAAQSHTAAGASPAGSTTEQPGRPRRPATYTGLDIRYVVSVSPDGRDTRAFPLVRGVAEGSPGQLAGIVAGDVIVEVNGRDSREDRVMWLEPGVRYTLRLRSGEQEREVVLVPLPPRARPATPAS